MKDHITLLLIACTLVSSCVFHGRGTKRVPERTPESEQALLDTVQKYTTLYFTDFAEPKTGLARERSNNTADIVTTGGSGFGLMAIVAAIERQYISREYGIYLIDKSQRYPSKLRFPTSWG